jgi:hypothetical protein
MTSAELEDDLSVAMENVLDRYAEAHSVDGASTNVTLLSALFMAVADVFNRAIPATAARQNIDYAGWLAREQAYSL